MKSAKNNIFYLPAMFITIGLIIAAVGFGLWTIFYTETGNGDNVEHIHATWLVAWGKVPYRDFFQHHNPLLWYLFAPVFKHIIDAMLLLDLAHALGIFAGIWTFFIVYKICRRFFEASALATLISLIILCPPYYYIYCFNFNPDTFMALAFAGGLYFLFNYWQNNMLSNLCFAFMLFFIAFMFTQKILVIFTGLAFISLYLFYKKKTPFSHIFYALSLPIFCLLVFITLLYSAGALELYWKSNYLFNVVMQKYYGLNKVKVTDYQMLIFSISIAFLSILCFFKSGNLFFKIISILFILEFPQRCFYFSIAPYYLLPLMIYACCLNCVLIDKIINKYFILIFAFLGVGIYYLAISSQHYLSVRGTDRSFARFITNEITPCDYVLSGYLGNQSIISKDPHYYWGLLGHVDMAGEEIGLFPHPNVSLLTETYKPKLIYVDVYWSSYEQNRGRLLGIQQIDPNIVNKYYIPTRFNSIYMLKYEYRKHKCRYDKNRKEWLYAD